MHQVNSHNTNQTQNLPTITKLLIVTILTLIGATIIYIIFYNPTQTVKPSKLNVNANITNEKQPIVKNSETTDLPEDSRYKDQSNTINQNQEQIAWFTNAIHDLQDKSKIANISPQNEKGELAKGTLCKEIFGNESDRGYAIINYLSLPLTIDNQSIRIVHKEDEWDLYEFNLNHETTPTATIRIFANPKNKYLFPSSILEQDKQYLDKIYEQESHKWTS